MKLHQLATAMAAVICMASAPAFAGTTISPVGSQDYDTGVLGTLTAVPVFFYGGIRATNDPVNTFTFTLSEQTDVYGSVLPFGGTITFQAVNLTGQQVATSTVGSSGEFSFFDLGAGNYTLNVLATNLKPGQLGFSGSISASVTPVPEPSSYALTFAGLAVAGTLMRRRKIS